MKALTATLAATGLFLVCASDAIGTRQTPAESRRSTEAVLSVAAPPVIGAPETWTGASDNALIQQYCLRCHNDELLRGNMSLERFDAADPVDFAELAEKIVVKLRAGMMPPPNERRPESASVLTLVESLESLLDAADAANPNPGSRSFQRLNQAEYSLSIGDLLGLEIDAADYLPLDTKSANFDNIADAQLLSPNLLNAYMNAAAEISRLAVGDPHTTATSSTYTNPGYTSQWDRVEGAPFGTRGGISVTHIFPADGDYECRLAFEHTTTGGFFGGVTQGEQIEVSIDGTRVALLDMDRWMSVADPNGVNMRTEPISVRSGPRRVTAAFIKQSEGPMEDLLSPHEWSLTDRQIGVSGYGVTSVAHLKDLVVAGPFRVTGVSDNAIRKRLFTCRPTTHDEESTCAGEIISRLATRAFRRPLAASDLDALMEFYAAAPPRAASSKACALPSRPSLPAPTSSSDSRRRRGASRQAPSIASATRTWPPGCRSSSGGCRRMTSYGALRRAACCRKQTSSNHRCVACWPIRGPERSARGLRRNGCGWTMSTKCIRTDFCTPTSTSSSPMPCAARPSCSSTAWYETTAASSTCTRPTTRT